MSANRMLADENDDRLPWKLSLCDVMVQASPGASEAELEASWRRAAVTPFMLAVLSLAIPASLGAHARQ